MALEPGATIGPYEILAKIGEGGMGEVYQARDTKLDRDVALKVLPEAFTADPDRLARFEREAKVLASLNHPNIGTIHGLEDSGDTKALVLELVEGPTLADRITGGALPVDDLLPIARQIAEALEAAHEQGVIHRDLKPANIKVRDDGTVKVLDFGLAKALQPDAAADPNLSMSPTISLTAAATQMGMIIGTAAYMAPEQAKGKTIDRRADIWAFGVVVYEMLTGARPFAGEDVSDTLAHVLTKQVEWTSLPDDTPDTIRQLLRRCLERDPRQRLRDIGEARIGIEQSGPSPVAADTDGRTDVAPSLRLWQRPVPAVMLALVIAATAALASLGVSSLTRPAPVPPDLLRFVMVPSGAPAPVATGNPYQDLAISADGAQVAYRSRDEDGTPQIVLRPIDQFAGAPVRGGVGSGPFFSPAGDWIGFVAAGSGSTNLQKVSVIGGPPVQLAQSTTGAIAGASWGRDDQIVFGTANGGLFRVPGGGGQPEALTTLDTEQGDRNHILPFVIPGRDAVLFTISDNVSDAAAGAQIAVLDLANGVVTRVGLSGTSPRWVATGHLIYGAGDGSVRAAPFDVDSLEVTGSPVPLVENVMIKNFGAGNFSLSDSGRLVYIAGTATGTTRTLVWVDREGNEEPIDAPPRDYRYARLSPDGTGVALDVRDDNSDIWIWDLARETLDRLTRDPGLNRGGVWSPDSARVAFTAVDDDGEHIYWQAADGSGTRERLTSSQGMQFPQAFTPDGSRLLYLTPATNPTDLHVVAVGQPESEEPLLNQEFSEGNGELSPDGRWLAYQSDESGDDEIYVRPFPDVESRRIVISTDGGSRPLWSRDGTELFYFINPGTVMRVPVDTGDDFTPGSPEVLFEGRYQSINSGRHYDVSPDGQRFLLLKPGDGAGEEDGQDPTVLFVDNWFEELTARVPVN